VTKLHVGKIIQIEIEIAIGIEIAWVFEQSEQLNGVDFDPDEQSHWTLILRVSYLDDGNRKKKTPLFPSALGEGMSPGESRRQGRCTPGPANRVNAGLQRLKRQGTVGVPPSGGGSEGVLPSTNPPLSLRIGPFCPEFIEGLPSEREGVFSLVPSALSKNLSKGACRRESIEGLR
jgi:hypothetical protein